MSDLMEDAAELVADQLKTHLSRTVTVRRGAQSFDASATIGRTSFEVESGDTVEKFQSRDFIFTAADYDFGAGQVEPARGDTITETIGSDTRTYELLELPDTPSWQFADGYHKTVRVHTKETQAA